MCDSFRKAEDRMLEAKLIKPLLITFVGTHLPLVATIGYGLIRGFEGLLPIIVMILASTLLGAAMSLFQVYSASNTNLPHTRAPELS